jgi:hypothetical protein
MGLCDPQWIPQEWREHSYDSGHTWSSLLGAARTLVPDSHDLKAMNIRQMCISKFIYITQSYLPVNVIILNAMNIRQMCIYKFIYITQSYLPVMS